MELFKIKIYLVIISTDKKYNKQYVLSSDADNITIPSFYLDSSMLEKLDTCVTEKAQELVFTNSLELMPQLISLHNRFIEEISGEINCVYGFVIDKIDNINNSFWIGFDYFNPNKYSNLIFETIQKLK